MSRSTSGLTNAQLSDRLLWSRIQSIASAIERGLIECEGRDVALARLRRLQGALQEAQDRSERPAMFDVSPSPPAAQNALFS